MIVALASASKAETKATKDTLTVDIAGGNSTLDPAVACSFADINTVNNLYARLTQYGSKPGPDGTQVVDASNIKPYFAKSWTVSGDGTVYTFTLPADWKFASGAPMDAEAVAYSLNRVVTMNSCGAYYLLDGYYAPLLIKSAKALDATTVQITLSHPDLNLLQVLAQPAAGIVDRTVVEANGGVEANKVNQWMASHQAGSGPYILADYKPNQSYRLTLNPAWQGEKPGTPNIIVNLIGDDSTLALRARSGQADVTLGMSSQVAARLAKEDCCHVVASTAGLAMYIAFPSNHDNGPFGNQKFREALSYAIPYDQIVEEAAFGYGSTYFGPYPPGLPQFDAALQRPRSEDLASARKLVEESGVKLPVNVTMIVNGQLPLEVRIANIAQAAFARIKVNVKIEKLAQSEYSERLNNGQTYEMTTHFDGPAVLDAGYYLAYDMTCKSTYNWSGVCLPETEPLIEQARKAADPAEQARLYEQIAKDWVAATPKIPVFAMQGVSVLSRKVKDYTYAPVTDFRSWTAAQ